MGINQKINLLLDKFVKNLYGIDMYLDKDSFNHTVVNVLVFPYKILERSPEYDPEYRENLGDVLNIFDSAMRHMGWPNNTDNYKFVLSKDRGTYLNDYLKNVMELLDMFWDTDYAPDYNLSDEDKKFELGSVNYYNFKSSSLDDEYENIIVTILSGKRNLSFLEPEIMDYLSNNMELDPQIEISIL